tara:strand:+ start:103 stop:444 length:342 start_codon:yes stop_codon:yes gene_type:complete
MNIFKGKEGLEEMNKATVTEFMKDIILPNRQRGGFVTEYTEQEVMRKNLTGGYESFMLKTPSSYEKIGTHMDKFRPIIDGTEYTWGELKKYPTPLLKVLAYRLWQQEKGSEEE